MSQSRPIAIAACISLAGLVTSPLLMAAPESHFQHPLIDSAALVSETELSDQRGRQKLELVQFNSQELEAVLADNSAIGTDSGSNNIAKEAFSNASGHLSVIQNSGNNVIIQDTTIYNITFID